MDFKDILKAIFGVNLSANLFLGKFNIQDLPLVEGFLIVMGLFLVWIFWEGLEWYMLNYVKPKLTRKFELNAYEENLKLIKQKSLLDKKYNTEEQNDTEKNIQT